MFRQDGWGNGVRYDQYRDVSPREICVAWFYAPPPMHDVTHRLAKTKVLELFRTVHVPGPSVFSPNQSRIHYLFPLEHTSQKDLAI
ncbi:hypothetical protein BABINDRAFT_124886 [Babjeviella inositovora NRRL Y-12698]|uniref:Uncharacterized protein n=1 Tax=Babjeviella inositovora NRRL Y-12698 TaxID=984486 RepID=A0A1E3QS86_9ASCO|nr:uncharacterized protein BABINDRAFT_124886 [Babjeviella inositovora NRRL Y-12698]ODQ80559.1 hypothetical protein BABINDRAFT_124886 [Babjeviella inositovora NRRL Y-12698]